MAQIFSVKLEGVAKALEILSPKLVRTAIEWTLNDTAQIAKKGLQDEMKKVFDRPTPRTLNSVYTKLDKAGDMPLVTIGIKQEGDDPRYPGKYLQPQVYGGTRPMKISEERYFKTYYVPSSFTKLDPYGNLPKGLITQILSSIGAFPNVGYMMNVTPESKKRRGKKLRKFFIIRYGTQSKRHPGVYEILGNGSIRPVLIFVASAPKYRVRFRFHEVAEDIMMKKIDRIFAEKLDKIMTAKM